VAEIEVVNARPVCVTIDERVWFAKQFESLPVETEVRTPSEWAEQRRYLPDSVTPYPGFFRWDLVPYMREIVDCLGPDSPVREVAVMKGVQIGATTAILENALGYYIDEVRTAPTMWVTGDADMAQIRLESNILPMIHHSGLDELVKSSDVGNARKTGRTSKKVEWVGGGCLLPIGAQNPNKFRQQPALLLLLDEVDAYPLNAKNEGDPVRILCKRAAAYESVRKICYVSSPTIQGQSQIESLFLTGDQRKYFVRCLRCGAPQTLKWERVSEDGVKSGIIWDTEKGRLVPGSVRYVCSECGFEHANNDKERLLSSDEGAEWRPTAEPKRSQFRSYHIPALLSPPGMQSWEGQVVQYLEAFDVERHRPRDLGLYQVFYNQVLGSTFELRGDRARFVEVSAHRRSAYRYGQIPNKWAAEHCGGPVLLLTCAVDVHKDNLAVAVFGWTRGRRAILIDYWRLVGETEQLSDPATWGALRKIIETREWEADDGKKYRIQLTLVDSGYFKDQVYLFCAEYQLGVIPIKGRDTPTANATIREFSTFQTPHGQHAFTISVDFYKDRWIASIRQRWDGEGLQRENSFNAPVDCTDDQLKELCTERKQERIDKRTNKRIGWEWHRTAGTRNELWDLLVYNSAALDIISWDLCRNQLKLEAVNWVAFFDRLEAGKLFFK